MTTPTLHELRLLFLHLFMETQCVLALERVSRAQLGPLSARAPRTMLSTAKIGSAARIIGCALPAACACAHTSPGAGKVSCGPAATDAPALTKVGA